MNSKETKQRYIDEFNSTELIKKQTIEDNVSFNLHFVQKAFFEVVGNSKKKYPVFFFDGENNLGYKTDLSSGMWASPVATALILSSSASDSRPSFISFGL